MKSPKFFSKSPPSPAARHEDGARHTRRTWFERIGLGSLIASVAGLGYAMVRSLVPNVLYEPSQRFKAGLPDQFPEGATFLEEQRVFIFREQKTFYAISAVCTHLGCTVKMVNFNQPKVIKIGDKSVPQRHEFQCPCHGSKYRGDGTNYAGPAPKSLSWFQLELAPEDGQLIVNLDQPVGKDFRLTV